MATSASSNSLRDDKWHAFVQQRRVIENLRIPESRFSATFGIPLPKCLRRCRVFSFTTAPYSENGDDVAIAIRNHALRDPLDPEAGAFPMNSAIFLNALRCRSQNQHNARQSQ